MARKEIFYGKMSDREKQQLADEVNILGLVRHPNIVRYYHRTIDQSQRLIHLYMEYCGNGDLANFIQNCRRERTLVPESLVWTILTQLVLALHKCHYETTKSENGSSETICILHRDLKPENSIFADYSIKLGDFGLSRKLDDPSRQFAQTYVGTPYYMSPEIISDQPYSRKSDIWALGCVVYELCVQTPPFNAKTQSELCRAIKMGIFKPLGKEYSPALRAFVASCLKTRADDRPDTRDLLKLEVIQLNVKERDAVQIVKDLKVREENLRNAEQAYQARLQALLQREKDCRRQEDALQVREAAIALRESKLDDSTSTYSNATTEITDHRPRSSPERTKESSFASFHREPLRPSARPSILNTQFNSAPITPTRSGTFSLRSPRKSPSRNENIRVAPIKGSKAVIALKKYWIQEDDLPSPFLKNVCKNTRFRRD
ncbi:G2-specific protein kinase nim-1 [Neolecta irregularis DAH-3]|uniref:non-specific serine/threonine protein kinase n=1 Tax=Neolecta irregularis (strain DAH-3) TaxID=1198029 RepID=A0A1U7LR16_NEOID|nr:G2-specific protein kinase nim-1 [Neolecta irregularis DAH-3]|eukprot:OLL25116.1 G2-specific protein kinase nim-1 [Neolecta irregularis DAH-3]